MPYTFYPDHSATRSCAMRHAYGDYQRRLVAGTESWAGPGGIYADGYARSRSGLLRRLRSKSYRCKAVLYQSMAISRTAEDMADLLGKLQAGQSGAEA